MLFDLQSRIINHYAMGYKGEKMAGSIDKLPDTSCQIPVAGCKQH